MDQPTFPFYEATVPVQTAIPPVERQCPRPGLYINTDSSASRGSCSSDSSSCSFESGMCLSHYSSDNSHASDCCSETDSCVSHQTPHKTSLLARALALSPRGADKRVLDHYPGVKTRSQFGRSSSTNCCNESELKRSSSVRSQPKSTTGFLFDDFTEEGREVRFMRCRNCQNVFSGNGAAQSSITSNTTPSPGASHRHLFCSGECYISLYALVHASQQRKQQEARLQRQQQIQQLQAQRDIAVRNRPNGC